MFEQGVEAIPSQLSKLLRTEDGTPRDASPGTHHHTPGAAPLPLWLPEKAPKLASTASPSKFLGKFHAQVIL